MVFWGQESFSVKIDYHVFSKDPYAQLDYLHLILQVFCLDWDDTHRQRLHSDFENLLNSKNYSSLNSDFDEYLFQNSELRYRLVQLALFQSEHVSVACT